MSKLAVCFQGWLYIDWDKVLITNSEGETVGPPNLDRSQIVEMLECGDLNLDFVACLRDCDDFNVEFSDFDSVIYLS